MRAVIFSMLTILSLSIIQSEETLVYVTFANKYSVDTKWSVEKKDSDLNITSVSSDKSTSILLTSEDFSLKKFEQKDPNKGYDLVATRTGNTLTITGKVNQGIKSKSYDIGSTPWVQEFAFGFKDFLSSKAKEYKFEILHPKDFDMHDMIAIKEQIEELTIDGTEYTAQKIKITLQGFKKRFWKGEAWYDVKTKNLLRYRANEGPGTPVKETILIKSKT